MEGIATGYMPDRLSTNYEMHRMPLTPLHIFANFLHIFAIYCKLSANTLLQKLHFIANVHRFPSKSREYGLYYFTGRHDVAQEMEVK